MFSIPGVVVGTGVVAVVAWVEAVGVEGDVTVVLGGAVVVPTKKRMFFKCQHYQNVVEVNFLNCITNVSI